MSTTGKGPRGARQFRGHRHVGVGTLVAALAVSACGGSASAAPTTAAGSRTGAGATPTAAATRNQATPSAGSGGANGGTAFAAASTALDALASYNFRVEFQSTSVTGSVTTASHTLMTGTVVNKPEKASSLLQSDLDASGNVTGGLGIVTIGSQAWISSSGPNGPWTEVPSAQADTFIQSLVGYRPEQMFGLYFAGIGGNFTAAGTETKNGVATTRYSGDQAVGALLGAVAGFQGQWSSDVWIANEGGYLVHSEAKAAAATGAEGGSFLILVDITNPNSAGPVQSPPPA
ncbi:MAG: hypothetical protein HY264_05915 [Chloroflexi bacterium]|nr:hypothetical protein [Chloroflexota bacterium]